jgi:hypothetical protein
MENATKALLIAAAILVAILIISLGLVVYNMAAETVQNVDMSDTEVKAFNDQFTRYEGTSQSGSTVNALAQTVLTSNLKYQDDTNKQVKVTGAITMSGTDTQLPAKVPTGSRYTITVTYSTSTQLVESINVTEN